MAITLTVDGIARTLEAEPEMPLLWLLRDELGIKGLKFGCGAGLCGACTVHLGGEAVRSCQITAGEAAGSDVVTIEGLGTPGNPHPVQSAWIAHQVAQCGYCQSGQIMQAAWLLETVPEPTDADIGDFMAGNLCRCGTYPRIRAAIRTAAAKLGRG